MAQKKAEASSEPAKKKAKPLTPAPLGQMEKGKSMPGQCMGAGGHPWGLAGQIHQQNMLASYI